MNAGDIVQLKSGGPLMTVKGPSQSANGLNCAYWSPKEEKFLWDVFPEAMLKLHNS